MFVVVSKQMLKQQITWSNSQLWVTPTADQPTLLWFQGKEGSIIVNYHTYTLIIINIIIMELLSHPNDLQKAACTEHHSCSSLPRFQPWQCWEDLPLIWKYTHDFTGKTSPGSIVNENKKAQLTWLSLVIKAIQVWVGVFSPRTVVEYLRKHKSCFPGRNPTLLLAGERWP